MEEAIIDQQLDEDAPMGFLLVGAMRAAIFSLKRGALSAYVKKRAFLQISSMAVKTPASASRKAASEAWDLKHYSMDMVKNTILGMTVFGTYEFIAFDPTSIIQNHDALNRKSTPATYKTNIPIGGESSLRSITAGSTSVVVHTGAGACAGVAHSAVIALWEIFWKKKRYPWQVRRLRILQHAIVYASLFGTYEGMRRVLEFGFYDFLAKQEAKVMEFLQLHPLDWMKREDGVYDITPVRWVFCMAAGGIAGQVHQIVSHAVANSKTLDWRKIFLVPIRSTWTTFWVTGLCFVAFEFGGEMTERYVKLERVQQGKLQQLEQRRIV